MASEIEKHFRTRDGMARMHANAILLGYPTQPWVFERAVMADVEGQTSYRRSDAPRPGREP